MDIPSSLPLEIARHIFQYLDAEDLGRCLRVSHSWRSIADDDLLWKQHCINYCVPDSPDDSTEGTQLLCHWARVWRSFALTPAYNWHCNKYKDLPLMRDDYTAFSLCGNHFTAYSQRFNNLDIFTVRRNSNRLQLVTSLALYLPKGDERATLSMSTNYIVVAKHNILQVFERKDNNYNLIKAFGIVLDSVIYADRDFSDFINSNVIPSTASEIIGIIDDSVWLTFNGDLQLVINIVTHGMANIFVFDSSQIQGNFFTTWSEDEVRIYDKEGNIAIYIDNIDGLKEVHANETLVSILRGYTSNETTAEIWDCSTGEIIFSKLFAGHTWSQLHPKEEVLFTLEASCYHNVYRITSWNCQSGAVLWVFNQPLDFYISYWNVRVVCERYLVIWPCAMHEDSFYLMDSNSGTLLYETPRPPYGINTISDSLWISVAFEHDHLFVRSFE